MNGLHLTFDELLTLKALKFKADISGRGNTSLFSMAVERDPDQAEATGMKNMCFRIHPFLQARFEVTLDALGMSKQEALTEALQEMLNRFDDKLRDVGIGAPSFDARLRELGYEMGPEDEHGSRQITRLAKEGA